MATDASQARNTFLTLLPTTNIAYKPSVSEPAQADTAVEGVDVLEAAQKTTRSSSSATDESLNSPRSSVDAGVTGDFKDGGFLRLGV